MNMTLRPFQPADAPTILSWTGDRQAFRLWSADRYPHYPATPAEMLAQYNDDEKRPLTAEVDGAVVGHLLLRYPSADHSVVRFGFVIVDNAQRGRGYGQQMLRLAIDYARREMGAKTITLGVFTDNRPALRCYESIGFQITGESSYLIDGEQWHGVEMAFNIL